MACVLLASSVLLLIHPLLITNVQSEVLRAAYHLINKHEGRLKGELAIAEVEQVFQAGPQQIHDHDVVVTLHTIPTDVGNAHCIGVK